MKKTLCVLIAAMLLLVSIPVVAGATAPGETATVTIRVTTNGAMAKVKINLDSHLEFVSASGGSVSPQNGNGSFIFGSGTSAIGSLSGTVTVRVKSGTPEGTYYVGGTLVECMDINYNSCSGSVSGGNVTVTGSSGKTDPPVGPDKTPRPYSGSTGTKTISTDKEQGIYKLHTVDEQTGEAVVKDVQVMVWGLSRCEVKLDGKRVTVKTLDLELSRYVPADQQLAVVYAPKTGNVVLRKNATGGYQIGDIKAGVIVPVLDIEGDVAQINYLGQVGWVYCKSLQFYAPCEGEGTGVIRNNSGNSVPLRPVRETSGYVKVCSIDDGTSVWITKIYSKNGWYAIDWNGYHGFVTKTQIRETGN